ncbi:hypothetical protein SAMN05660841_03075 [Sphingobacterium nematocida]|uniref:Uncharacterized protein n=1 Tax=Sphingobacterium nematocida TaxID=1513896 RepID=A0A1T5F6C5_9SPHI|nr:hypothetical protein [Sphingobacterium nematocida]SKB91722.1 hypothetical protein SAMN05660841_03075 [Sphingobacterium nematocida]
MSINSSAQSEYQGLYPMGGGAKAYLFDDGRFVIGAYATVVVGDWVKEKNVLVLKPQKAKFMLFGKQNPELKKEEAHIEFRNFGKDDSFFCTDTNDCKPIFDLQSTCEPEKTYATTVSIKTKTILLGGRETYQFQTGLYNDFIALYHNSNAYDRDYRINISQENNDKANIKQLSDLSEEEQSFWLDYKAVFDIEKANTHFAIAPDYKLIKPQVDPNKWSISETEPLFEIKCN